MSVAAALAILKAAPAVTAIVGAGDAAKISPLVKLQGISPPAVTLQRSVEPQNHLRGFANLDSERVQLDVWADSYAEALALAAACRAAIQAAGITTISEIDNHDPEVDPGLYRITQDYQFWV